MQKQSSQLSKKFSCHNNSSQEWSLKMIQKIINLHDQGNIQYIEKFTKQKILDKIDRQHIQVIDKFSNYRQNGFNLLQFVRFFLNIINHEYIQNLYMTIGLIDLFKTISTYANQQRVTFSNITNFFCQKILEKQQSKNQIQAKNIPNINYIKPNYEIKDFIRNPPIIFGSIDQTLYKLSAVSIQTDKSKHMRAVNQSKFSYELQKVFTLDALSQYIGVYDYNCNQVNKIYPSFSKMKKDIVILNFDFSQKQYRIGAVLKNFSIVFWDSNNDFQYEKAWSTTSYCQYLQTYIKYLQYFNQWVTSDKTGTLYFWNMLHSKPERVFKCKYYSLVNNIQQIPSLNLIAIVQQSKHLSSEQVSQSNYNISGNGLNGGTGKHLSDVKDRKNHNGSYFECNITFYNYFTGEIITEIQSADDRIPHTISYSEQYQILFSAGLEKKIKLFEINPIYMDSNLKGELIGHQNLITSFTLIKKTSLLISCDDKGKIKLWDFKNFACIQTIDFSDKSQITNLLDMIQIGKIGILGSRIHFVQFQDRQQIIKKVHSKQRLTIECIQHDQNRSQLYIFTQKDLRVVDLKKGYIKYIYGCFKSSNDNDYTCWRYFSCIGKFAIGNDKGQVCIYQISTGTFLYELKEMHDGSVINIEYDQLNKLWITIGIDSSIIVHKESSHEMIREIKGNFNGREIACFQLSVYHSFIAVSTHAQNQKEKNEKSIYLWNYQFGKLAGEIVLPKRVRKHRKQALLLLRSDQQKQLQVGGGLRATNHSKQQKPSTFIGRSEKKCTSTFIKEKSKHLIPTSNNNSKNFITQPKQNSRHMHGRPSKMINSNIDNIINPNHNNPNNSNLFNSSNITVNCPHNNLSSSQEKDQLFQEYQVVSLQFINGYNILVIALSCGQIVLVKITQLPANQVAMDAVFSYNVNNNNNNDHVKVQEQNSPSYSDNRNNFYVTQTQQQQQQQQQQYQKSNNDNHHKDASTCNNRQIQKMHCDIKLKGGRKFELEECIFCISYDNGSFQDINFTQYIKDNFTYIGPSKEKTNYNPYRECKENFSAEYLKHKHCRMEVRIGIFQDQQKGNKSPEKHQKHQKHQKSDKLLRIDNCLSQAQQLKNSRKAQLISNTQTIKQSPLTYSGFNYLNNMKIMYYQKRYILVIGNNRRLKIYNEQKKLVCDLNINYPLPYKWQFKPKIKKQQQDKIYFAIKVMNSIIHKYESDISIGESKNYKLKELFEKVEAQLTEEEGDEGSQKMNNCDEGEGDNGDDNNGYNNKAVYGDQTPQSQVCFQGDNIDSEQQQSGKQNDKNNYKCSLMLTQPIRVDDNALIQQKNGKGKTRKKGKSTKSKSKSKATKANTNAKAAEQQKIHLIQEQFTRNDLNYHLVKKYNFHEISGPTLKQLDHIRKIELLQKEWKDKQLQQQEDRVKLLKSIQTKVRKNQQKQQLNAFLTSSSGNIGNPNRYTAGNSKLVVGDKGLISHAPVKQAMYVQNIRKKIDLLKNAQSQEELLMRSGNMKQSMNLGSSKANLNMIGGNNNTNTNANNNNMSQTPTLSMTNTGSNLNLLSLNNTLLSRSHSNNSNNSTNNNVGNANINIGNGNTTNNNNKVNFDMGDTVKEDSEYEKELKLIQSCSKRFRTIKTDQSNSKNNKNTNSNNTSNTNNSMEDKSNGSSHSKSLNILNTKNYHYRSSGGGNYYYQRRNTETNNNNNIDSNCNSNSYQTATFEDYYQKKFKVSQTHKTHNHVRKVNHTAQPLKFRNKKQQQYHSYKTQLEEQQIPKTAKNMNCRYQRIETHKDRVQTIDSSNVQKQPNIIINRQSYDETDRQTPQQQQIKSMLFNSKNKRGEKTLFREISQNTGMSSSTSKFKHDLLGNNNMKALFSSSSASNGLFKKSKTSSSNFRRILTQMNDRVREKKMQKIKTQVYD